MKTDDLITMLATGAGDESVGNPWRKLMLGIGFGTIGSTFLMVKAIPVNPALGTVIQLLEFWVKLGFAASIAAISLLLVIRLSQPGVRVGKALPVLMAPILPIWILAGIAFAGAEPDTGPPVLRHSLESMSLPYNDARFASFCCHFWGMRDLAPTRLRLAGAAAGLFSGAVGAVVYCFHCPSSTHRLSPSGIC